MSLDSDFPVVQEKTAFPALENEWVVAEEGDKKLEVMREKALENLEKKGIIEIKKDNANNKVIVFDEKLFDSEKIVISRAQKETVRNLSEEIENSCGLIRDDPRYGDHKVDRTLYHVFGKDKIVSKTDFEKSVPDEKNGWSMETLPNKTFFYIPNDEKEVFSLDALRSKKDTFYYLYGLGSKNRDQAYPTEVDGLNSNLKLPDVIIPALIYLKFNGERDDTGKLWVDSLVEGEILKRGYSTEWLSKVAKYRIDQYAETDGDKPKPIKPKDYIDKFCPRVIESGLMRETDFKEYSKPRDEIGRNGQYLIGENRFLLGKRYAGCKVIQISETEYAVVNKKDAETGVTEFVFDSRLTPEQMTRLSPKQANEGSGTISYVSAEFINKLGEITTATTYDSAGNRKELKQKTAEIVQNIMKFREELKNSSVELSELNGFSLKEQAVMFKELGKMTFEDRNKCINLIAQDGQVFLKLLKDRAFYGGFDSRLLTLSDIEKNTREKVLENYSLAQTGIDNWSERMLSLFGKDQKNQILVNRIVSSFRVKSAELLVADVMGNEAISEQFGLMKESLEAFTQVFEDATGYEKPKSWIKNFARRKSKEVTSVTGVYNGKEENTGKKIKITFRPVSINTEKNKAQARIGFVYINKDKKEFKFRIDHDVEWGGMSLDMGDSDGIIGRTLREIGSTHHITGAFDKVFSEAKVFAGVVKSWARILGFEFSETKK